MVAAVLCGLVAMHGLQPSSVPHSIPGVVAVSPHHGGIAADSPAPGRAQVINKACPHGGHAGGEVCLASIAAGTLLLLLGVAAGHPDRPLIPSGRSAPPRRPSIHPRAPTLEQLSVLRM
jgi:hypothetical protein